MCLIITAIAALAATAGWYFRRNVRIGALALIYWGAALMWLVDGLFRAADGKAFFDFSLRDAALGTVVVLCGLCAEVVMPLCSSSRNMSDSLIQRNNAQVKTHNK